MSSPIRAAAGLGLALVAGALALFPASAGADELPEGYAYELVSPERTQGQRVVSFGVSLDETGVLTASAGGYADTQNLPATLVHYLTTRTANGWKSSATAPPAIDFPFIGPTGAYDWSGDLRRTLWFGNLAVDKGTMRFTPVVGNGDGTFTVIGPAFDEQGLTGETYPVGASSDLGTVVMETRVRNAYTDGRTDTRAAFSSLVLVGLDDDGEPTARQVGFRNGATMLPNCIMLLGGSRSARGAVSDDGEQVIFSFGGLASCRSAANQRVWTKIGDADPIDLAATRCTTSCGTAAIAVFEGASRDGSRVYFTTEQKLLDSDTDTSARRDLYEYDFNAPSGSELRSLTSSALPEGAGVTTATRISEDGSYVYFVATGRPLAGENARGVAPQTGENNFYVYHRDPSEATATIKFIGALTAADVSGLQFSLTDQQQRPAATSTDGRFLAFLSNADLTGERSADDAHRDMFRYDAVEDKLVRIWTDDPEHNGAARSDGPWFSPAFENYFSGALQGQRRGGTWPISDDGETIAFTTGEPLSVEDVNGVNDVYMWRESTGRLTMISDGESPFAATFNGVSRSGETVLFNSTASLTGWHTSGALALWAVRKGGGFPEPPVQEPRCDGDGCQGAIGLPPVLPSAGSVDFSGGGNVPGPGRAVSSVSVPRLKAVRGVAARLRVKVPGAGRIAVSGALVRSTGRTTSKAAAYKLKVVLSANAKRKLEQKRKLTARIKVAFRPTGGRLVSKTVTVTFKQSKKKGGR
jgi:hypothetical protein